MPTTRALFLAVLGMMAAPAAADSVPCPVRDLEALSQSELSERVYTCFGAAAASIDFRGEKLDRLTVLSRLTTEPDPSTRRELFLALQPVWQAMDGHGAAASPWRALNRLHAGALRAAGRSSADAASALGIDPMLVEPWLLAVLEAWRDGMAHRELEPWDYYFAAGAMERALSAHLPLVSLRPLNDRIYRELGADPVILGIEYDIAPRPGKDPVAFTDFVVRQRPLPDGTWAPGRYRVSAAYAVGGVGNFAELLHETGHGIHIAAIRAQPGLVDWPDSDTFTEALADIVALDLYDPAFQQHYLGTAVPPADALRAKYAGIVLDTAWALFEIRMQADPARDPNDVWTGITGEYLRIRPHPEWSWWALRGQLVSNPGYMLNYALGAILIADLRERTQALFGARPWGDASWYDRVSAGLLRHGLERPSRRVIEEFLGRPVSPAALLRDLAGQGAR